MRIFRYLTDKVSPGNRVTITGIYSIKRNYISKPQGGNKDKISGTRPPYLRVVGIQVQTSGVGRSDQCEFAPEEERQFKELAKV